MVALDKITWKVRIEKEKIRRLGSGGSPIFTSQRDGLEEARKAEKK